MCYVFQGTWCRCQVRIRKCPFRMASRTCPFRVNCRPLIIIIHSHRMVSYFVFLVDHIINPTKIIRRNVEKCYFCPGFGRIKLTGVSLRVWVPLFFSWSCCHEYYCIFLTFVIFQAMFHQINSSRPCPFQTRCHPPAHQNPQPPNGQLFCLCCRSYEIQNRLFVAMWKNVIFSGFGKGKIDSLNYVNFKLVSLQVWMPFFSSRRGCHEYDCTFFTF